MHSFVDELPDRIYAAELPKYLSQAAEKGLPPELIELQIQVDYNYTESRINQAVSFTIVLSFAKDDTIISQLSQFCKTSGPGIV